MQHKWSHLPALLAGAGVLAAALCAIQPPNGSQMGQAGLQQPTLMGLRSPSPDTSRPSEAVIRTVELVARGSMPSHYFAAPQAADQFQERWQGGLIEGKVLMAQADEFDAGAENGHRVPVQLWLDSGSRVMGLAGQAAFEPGKGGLKIRELQLAPQTLQVESWAAAKERLRRAYPAVPEPVAATAPFYGLFRFSLGDGRYAVDAQSGRVVRE